MMKKMKRELILLICLSFALACNVVQRTAESTSVGGVLGETPANEPSTYGQALLNEIRFMPEDGQTQFIELKNNGSGSAALGGLELSNEAGQTYLLPDDLSFLAPGTFFLIVFDGQHKIDGLTLHADRADFLNPTSGWVALSGKNGAELDRVAWGNGQVGSVNLSPGGVAQDPEPGMTIGRYPLATETDPAEWVAFTPEQATPGMANPVPAVQVLLPLSGALMAPEDVILTWYPVAGAAQYKVQVSQDMDFTTLQVDEPVSDPTLKVSSLSVGTYYWRVQAIDADGSRSELSPINMLTLDVPGTSGHLFAPALHKKLSVPLLFQHKDTAMLLLESKNESGAHAWDVAHPGLDKNDPADKANCVLASVAMINHYYGGNLSQDRIGYYIRKNANPKGSPEGDLNYNAGFDNDEATTLLKYALGVEPTVRPMYTTTVDTFWKDIKASIDAGRPVLANTTRHAFVIIGYYTEKGDSYVTINDPWYGTYDVNISHPEQSNLKRDWATYFLIPSGAIGTQDDPAIFQDSDGDGVINIDETERFHTDPFITDTDQDGVNDKQDIASGVFDLTYGYAFHPGGSGRDIDGDKLPTELDEDSDNGGCLDGTEDTNGDGKYEPELGEIYNFDPKDDMCIKGTSAIVFDFTCQNTSGSQVLTIREWGHKKGEFSVRSDNEGKLEGTATITDYDYGIHYDMSSAYCNPIEWSSVKPSQWTAKLTGEYQIQSDGSIKVSIQPTPEFGPQMMMTTNSTCGVQVAPQAPVDTAYWTILPGTLVNEHLDLRQTIYSLPSSCTGDAYIDTHMEVSPGFK